MDDKRFRFDLWIALLALLISGIAAGSSAYQTYVIRKQFSATVWPYLTFVTSSSTDRYFEVDIDNAGIGPALIFSAVITRDGRVIQRPPGANSQPAIAGAIQSERMEAKADEDAAKAHVHGNSSMTASTIFPGDVISAGQKLELLRVEGKFFTRRVLADARRIDLKLCYCSLLGDCWTKRFWEPSVQPHAVKACSAA
ncbi:MAG: hypothetical protein JO078_04755 [Candidatus Eremiobacteraeota bacterium]|nr:hypothetical protein [Candidatus Eremiobacteraeota bacterium]MBV9057366.1 hypothetical protein [Candidatus Eremiobacteraeota bacterium]MBV9699417.1 hypothetical protein [Candidatus Eremiobacteraeota bacterium]